MRTKSISLSLTLALLACLFQLVACGTLAPTTESIEDHIASPTGNVDDTSISAALKQSSMGTAKPTSTGPTGTNEQPLTAQQVLSLTPQQTMIKVGVPKPAAAWLQPQLLLKQPTPAQSLNPMGGLVLKNIDNPMACIDKLDLTSKNLDVTMEMKCLANGSGSIRISTYNIGLTELSKEPEELDGQIQVQFNNACDDKGNCINGQFRMKLDISKAAKRIKTVLGYNLEITAKGQATIKSKGGLRLQHDGSSKDASLEVVAFVKDASGNEGSIVLLLASEGQTQRFAIKGANGSFSCAATNDGTGRCTATDNKDTKEITWNLR